jgi:hypothetical protein
MFLPLRGGESTLYRGSCDGLAPVLLVTAKVLHPQASSRSSLAE